MRRLAGRGRIRRVLGVALAGVMIAVMTVASGSGAGASTCGAVPSGEWLGTWTQDNTPGAGGVVKFDLAFPGPSVNGVMEFATGQVVFAGDDAVTGTRAAGSCSFTAEIGNLVTINALIASSGTEMSGSWVYHPVNPPPGFPTFTGTWSVGRVTGSAATTGTDLTTDPDDVGVSATTPLVTGVTSPTAGPLTIDQALVTGGGLKGFSILDTVVRITAPAGSAAAPLALSFDLDHSATRGLPPSSITVYRNGEPVQACIFTSPSIAPDPCVSDVEPLAAPQDGVHFTVLTSEASTWMFGTPSAAPSGFRVTTATLPAGHAGQAYTKALDATGGSPPFKWKRSGRFPKGLKLSKDGVISGTPKTAGTSTVTVQVSYKLKIKKQPTVKKVASKSFTLAVT
jgi:hypothetical protein